LPPPTIDMSLSAVPTEIDHCDLTFITCCHRQGMSMAELTDRFFSRVPRRVLALKTCPHWHSVFSSVFKEPKLGHILAAMFCLLGLVPALPEAVTPAVERRSTLAPSVGARNLAQEKTSTR